MFSTPQISGLLRFNMGFLMASVLLFPLNKLNARLRDVTDETGIKYLHSQQDSVPLGVSIRPDRLTKTVVSNTAGAAAVDVNGDGWTDFLAARYEKTPVLFINQGDGIFLEEAALRGLDQAHNAGSFGCGDFDNDGDKDLFVAQLRGDRFQLFINDGQGHFQEEARMRGAAVPVTIEDHESYSIGLVDYDRDGYLDIYVSEWGVLSHPEENSKHSILLHNLGIEAPGHFENVTLQAGLLQPPETIGEHFAMSSGWADFDGDGWQDLSLIGEFGVSQFYWNNGDGTFSKANSESGTGLEKFGMGVAVGDINNDGLLDYYATSIHEPLLVESQSTHTGNKLYQNLGNRRFVEIAEYARVDHVGWSWGASFFEYENDGDIDLIVTNGMDAAGLGISGPFWTALDDPTTLLQNDGVGRFADITSLTGVRDRGMGKAVVILDYDNDGDQDVIITNTYGEPVVYQSNATEIHNKWIRFELEGTTSNRDAIGAVLRVFYDGKSQIRHFNPSNAYIGQHEAYVHFGLGGGGNTIERVEISWPSGAVQTLSDLQVNRLHFIKEPQFEAKIPQFVELFDGGAFEMGSTIELHSLATADPAPVYVWKKDGVKIEEAVGPTYEIERMTPPREGLYTVTAINPGGSTESVAIPLQVSAQIEEKSVARWWNEILLEAIRMDFPAPTIHSRNLYHLSAVMWDAYWAYEENAWENVKPVFHQENLSPSDWNGDRLASQREAISYAAFRMLVHRYRNSVKGKDSVLMFEWLMKRLRFDPNNDLTSGNSPAAVGNRIAQAVIDATLNDGSNEANGYADTSGYEPENEPMVHELTGTEMVDPNRWQPLAFEHQVTQNGIIVGKSIQSFVGVNWRAVASFALDKPTPITVDHDPGSPPMWGTETEKEFIDSAVQVIEYSSLLNPRMELMVDISPGNHLNNSLGSNDGDGHPVNPYTNTTYESNPVNLADYGRILAEFWADGPASETPPGHWSTIFNQISDHPLMEYKIGGNTPVASRLEWDILGYLALGGGMHDAALAAWTIKRQYDYSRPISMIRFLSSLGQSSDPQADRYNEHGLPLVDGLIEIITEQSSAIGERHAHLSDYVGNIAVRAWVRPNRLMREDEQNTGWILGEDWIPYQKSTFVTPAFAAYVSGHSCFSRAAAEILTRLTGDSFFPGGMGSYTFKKNEFLKFETGPTEDVTLQWATYYDAADEAGVSRLWGGIHVPADDFNGRIMGAQVGEDAFEKAMELRGFEMSQ